MKQVARGAVTGAIIGAILATLSNKLYSHFSSRESPIQYRLACKKIGPDVQFFDHIQPSANFDRSRDCKAKLHFWSDTWYENCHQQTCEVEKR